MLKLGIAGFRCGGNCGDLSIFRNSRRLVVIDKMGCVFVGKRDGGNDLGGLFLGLEKERKGRSSKRRMGEGRGGKKGPEGQVEGVRGMGGLGPVGSGAPKGCTVPCVRNMNRFKGMCLLRLPLWATCGREYGGTVRIAARRCSVGAKRGFRVPRVLRRSRPQSSEPDVS